MNEKKIEKVIISDEMINNNIEIDNVIWYWERSEQTINSLPRWINHFIMIEVEQR